MTDRNEDRPRRGPRDFDLGPGRHAFCTSAEHDALVVATHRLEAALASAAPGRERTWARRVGDDFERVHEALSRHVTAAESRDGLFAEVQRSRPTMAPQIGDFRRQHAEMMQAADDLRDLARERDPTADLPAIRRKTADLLFAVRHHHGDEVDALLEAFWTDLGTGD